MVKSIRAACSSAHRSTHLERSEEHLCKRILLAIGQERKIGRRRSDDELEQESESFSPDPASPAPAFSCSCSCFS
eukprot:767949-Hanusia_phi.AAC.10